MINVPQYLIMYTAKIKFQNCSASETGILFDKNMEQQAPTLSNAGLQMFL